MADLYRLTVRMDGWPGAPGFMTFYCLSPTPFRSAVVAFIDAVKGNFPASVTFTVPVEIDKLDDSSGDLVGIETEGTTYTTAGIQTSGYAAPAGACISWITNAFAAGRRVRGRTFLVPLAGVIFQTDGTLDTVPLGNMRNAAVDLFTACDLAVWRRPHTADPAKPGDVSYPGAAYEVTGAQVSDRAAVLRSRRS